MIEHPAKLPKDGQPAMLSSGDQTGHEQMATRTKRFSARNFKAWLKRMGMSDSEAARKLGASRNSVAAWKKDGAPLYVGMATAILENSNGPKRA